MTPWNGCVTMKVAYPDAISTGEVSPIPRATARISAVARPGRAVGSTTCQIVRHRLAPRPNEASRRLPGTTRSTTSEARATIGSIITLIASAPAKPERGSCSVMIQTE
jgi:hypothetical protein